MAYITDSFDDEVIRLLQNDGVGLLPTDTIYGLSCRAQAPEAVDRLHKLKRRDESKPFIILISDIKMLEQLSISARQARGLEKYWPGAISIIFPAPGAPEWLHRGIGTLAVRMPDNPDLPKLINQVGPLISTSANLRDQKPVSTAIEAQAIFGDKLNFYVDKGTLNNPPSTVAALSGTKLRLIRQGTVKIK